MTVFPWRTLAAVSFVVVCALFVVMTMVSETQAQPVAIQAEVKAVNGRVEVLRRGQTQWIPATVGAKLAEGDEIRAWGGASAELELPDGTNLVVAENTRLAVTKVTVDPQSRSRVGVFHLAVGKVRATLAEGALKLVQSRQSNFAITTPGGVAAARGTTFVISYDDTAEADLPSAK